jgi:hypothetical protein
MQLLYYLVIWFEKRKKCCSRYVMLRFALAVIIKQSEEKNTFSLFHAGVGNTVSNLNREDVRHGRH